MKSNSEQRTPNSEHQTAGKYFCGLDLASVERNPTGIAIIKDRKNKPELVHVSEALNDEEIIKTVNRFKPQITAIDAPFSLGRTTFRKCESDLIRIGYKLFPPSFLMSLISRCKKLLPDLGGTLIEAHPLTSKKALNIPISEKEDLISELSEHIGGLNQDYSVHEIDAIVGAYTAYLHYHEETLTYGDSEGKIIVPIPRLLKLAVFDLDGTITKPVSSWEFIHKNLNTWDIGKVNLEKFLSDKIDYAEFAKADALPWKGTPLTQINDILSSAGYIDGARDLIVRLKEAGVKVAVISGGLKFLADKVAQDLGIDFVFANELTHDGTVLDGSVKVSVDYNGKLKVYKKLLKVLKLKPYQVMTVGDSSGDIVLFENSGLAIAINPIEQIVSDSAHFTCKDATEILKFLGLETVAA